MLVGRKHNTRGYVLKKNAVIRSYEYNAFIQEEFEDIKEVFRIRKTKKDRQYNGQKKKKKSIVWTIVVAIAWFYTIRSAYLHFSCEFDSTFC